MIHPFTDVPYDVARREVGPAAAEPVPAVRAYRIVLTWVDEDPDNPGWVATVPALPGCVTQGDTEAESPARVQEAISAYLASLARHGEPIPRQTPTGQW
jgi:antitoxin HicB